MWAFLLTLGAKFALLPGILAAFFTGTLFTSVLANIKKNWRFYLPALLLATNIFAFHGWTTDHSKLLAERAAHQLDVQSFKAAQAAANKQAETEKRALLKESKANADQADAKYASLFASYRANLLRYKASLSQGNTDQAEHNQLPTPQGGDGPSKGTDVPFTTLPISLDDASICAENTARLQAVHDWAVTLPKGDN